MKALCLTWALACPSLASAAELRHFNPEIFGKGANSTVTLLLDKSGEINPSLIQLDVKDGRFYGATLRYPAEITLDEARRSLNKLYARWQKPNFTNDPTMGLWRNQEKGFSIQLTRDTNEIVVIYISFSQIDATKSKGGSRP